MTREEAIKYLDNIVSCLGTDFHPDDPMEYYFSNHKEAQEGLDKCFEVLGDEIYDISLKLIDESTSSLRGESSSNKTI